MPLVADIETPLEVVAMAALSLGLAYVGTCNEDIAQALLSPISPLYPISRLYLPYISRRRCSRCSWSATSRCCRRRPTPTLTLTQP